MLVCKESARGLDKTTWNLRADKSVIMKQLWTWDKADGRDAYGDPISGVARCTYFEKELCFEIGNIMRRKER